MRFSTATLFASFVAAVMAGPTALNANAFSAPNDQSVLSAGEPFTLKWNPDTQGTVILTLHNGVSTNLDSIGVIASKFLIFETK